jgi:AcrR family transcriptional regulator
MAKVQVLTSRQQGRRHRILSAARQMLTEAGYEGTVMSKVAERTDVSPTTLYNLYNTKDELLLEALANTMAGAFWATFLLWTKGLMRLPDMEQYMQRNILSILIPASCGSARKDLQSRYDQLDKAD